MKKRDRNSNFLAHNFSQMMRTLKKKRDMKTFMIQTKIKIMGACPI